MKKMIFIGLFTATTALSAAPTVYGQQNTTQQGVNTSNPAEQSTTQQGQTGGTQQGAYQQKQNAYKQNKGPIAEAAAAAQAQAPVQDRFSTPDDEKLGVEVRGLIIETVGPDQSKGVILIIDKGDIQLSGKIGSEERKKALIDALTKYKGVKSVNNKLTTSSADQKK